MKKTLLTTAIAAALVPALTFGAAACSGSQNATSATVMGQTTASGANGNVTAATNSGSTAASTGSTGSGTAAAVATAALTASYKTEDTETGWDASSAYQIKLNGSSIESTGTGATVAGSTVTVGQPGTYVISGTLSDGQVKVDVSAGGDVRLVLNGVDITCSTGPAIYVLNADKTIITLADGTQNNVTDGAQYAAASSGTDSPNATIYSKDDISFNGAGTLTVKANYKNGIESKNDLKFAGGTYTIDAVNDAVKGKDSVGVQSGAFTITAGGDGFQSTNDTETDKGFVAIDGGTFSITAAGDALQAQTTLLVAGGDFTVVTGGGSANGKQRSQGNGPGGNITATTAAASGSPVDSSKGLKAAGGVFVTGGTLNIDSADDSVHSNGAVQITEGTVNMKSGDDGIHSDGIVQIDGGDITIAQSYEGIEGMSETYNGGTVHITSSDDGINVAGGADGSASNNFANMNADNPNNVLTINNGYISIDAGGDGLDSNGSFYMTNGTVIVNGPTNNGNGAIDYNGAGKMTGGSLVAVGSSGMAEMPASDSTVYSIMVNFSSAQQADTLVHMESSDGRELITVAPSKQFQSIVVASPAIKKGATYKVFLGGSDSGTLKDTIYTGGSYSGGSEYVSLTVEGVVTTSGQTGGFGGPQGGQRKRPGTPAGG
jgi:hypothetical protein